MARRPQWEATPSPRPDLPAFAPMRTVPPGMHTPLQWRDRSRAVKPECLNDPRGYGWRQPGVFRGHYYGGWLPLYDETQTKTMREAQNV